MNLREIEVFQSIMLCGTASRAAEVLGISQPAVSKALKGLEASVGFLLFDRVKGRLVPTPEGQLFFREVEQSFEGLVRLRAAAARIHDFGSGDLRVGSLSAFSLNLVPDALRQFHSARPNVAITFQVQSSSVVRDLIASGQFDIGIAADEIDTTGIVAEPYFDVRAAIALYPGHALANKTTLSPADLHSEPFVALAPEDTTRREAEQLFHAKGVRPRVVAETPYSSTVCALVLARLGCGIIDPVTAPGFIERGLILKPFDPAIYFRTLLLFPPDRRRSQLVDELVKELHSAKARYAEHFGNESVSAQIF